MVTFELSLLEPFVLSVKVYGISLIFIAFDFTNISRRILKPDVLNSIFLTTSLFNTKNPDIGSDTFDNLNKSFDKFVANLL